MGAAWAPGGAAQDCKEKWVQDRPLNLRHDEGAGHTDCNGGAPELPVHWLRRSWCGLASDSHLYIAVT
ncbi:hypothetical protein SKAU_G00103510 [Synaphobranchus kaupii]|uniref:Uncharacterized protein n=1 Tax=Synaphobranchus kaupii TaxID=118154 RepID=A0A9Q1J7P4_SYNKA|nr:hypothetical protein SKAU_G00103510 [Synaphobranchus kaupii]